MRKFISIFLVSMFLAAALSLNAQAVQKIKKGNVSYGTPAIDGVMDDCYKNSSELVIEYIASIANSATENDTPAKGIIRLCWDEKYMYMYVDVADSTPATQPFDNFSSDAFESVFDFDNLGDGTYGENGLFVKVLAYAKTVGSPEFEIDWVPSMETSHQASWAELPESEHQVSCVIKPDGYIIERRVPLNDAVKAMLKPGYTFGFQIWLLDDIDDNNQRDFKLVWGEPTDEVDVGTWSDSNVCDELTLVEAPKPEPEPEPEIQAQNTAAAEQPNPVVTPEPIPSPQTGDASIILSFISLIGAGGLSAISFKKRR